MPAPDHGGGGAGRLAIRPARPGDLGAVVRIMAAGALVPGREDPTDLAPYRAALADIEASGGSMVLVAEEPDPAGGPGRVVGACQLIMFRHLQHHGGRCAEIESMHVDADRRSAGIGGALLEEAVRLAAEAGCYRVQLTSHLDRADAHRFYERHGFAASHRGFKRLLS